MVTDSNIITSKEENKWFSLEFESVGAGTCVVMDFNDGIVESYGDAIYCSEWAPDVPYIAGVQVNNPMEFPHVYKYLNNSNTCNFIMKYLLIVSLECLM